ncbi:transposable element Tcb1 transposase [Trichonephila clavipes]|nr:transposable element Tcb1 transposase [Trichonephila clavipes]
MSASSIRRRLLYRGLRVRMLLYRIFLTANHQRLRLQWAHEHRACHIRVNRYAGERGIPECVIERHCCLTAGVMIWGVISYHGRSNLLRIEGNLSSIRYVREVLQPEEVPFL